MIPANNTAMEFDALRKEFYTGNAAFWMYGIWDLGSVRLPDLRAAERGGRPSSPTGDGSPSRPRRREDRRARLTHPIVYAVAADAADPELAVRLLALASDAELNTDHAVTTTHLGIKPEQLEDPRYAEAWPLARATELLEITKFLPNNPQFGDLNGDPLHRDPGGGERAADGGGGGRLRHRRGVGVAR